ncbi:hypothetical protein AB0J01_37935 [Streptomyces sp. NPDC050204]|uniref:hypothetical protein n=1 Tax=Streptomyces sp. NPDC050204 TaxID=3155514 RepID=UPI0034209EDE
MGAALRDGSEHPFTLPGRAADALDAPGPDPRHSRPPRHGRSTVMPKPALVIAYAVTGLLVVISVICAATFGPF